MRDSIKTNFRKTLSQLQGDWEWDDGSDWDYTNWESESGNSSSNLRN